MSGGGIGGTLGSLAGAALAPETGGLSLAIPALAGAAGAALGGGLTGSKNIGLDALLGGIGGGLSGASGLGSELGISDSAGLFGDAADTATSGLANAASGASGFGGQGLSFAGVPDPVTGATVGAANSVSGAGTPAASGIMGYLGKQNPLNLALAGGSVLSGVSSLLPHKKVDVGQNAADVLATSPGFSGSLPQYSIQNTATPYAGDWYKYGQQPQAVMYNGQPQRLAEGGMVKGYAAGGQTQSNPLIPQQQSMPQMPPQSSVQSAPNPLLLKGLHTVGVAIGEHLKKHSPLFTGHGQVHGKGGGQDDAVPAKLSQGEFVVPSEVVSQLGDGASDAGADKLHKMIANVRKHKTSQGAKFPPKAHNPLSYLKKK